MDSGCSYHMHPKKDYFETLKLKEEGTVLLGDHHPCQVQGIGTIILNMFDNREYILKDVSHVPDLKRNLISISMFGNLGFATKTQHVVLKILNGSLVIAKGNKDKNNGLFILDGSTVMAHASTTRNDINKTKLWHNYLGKGQMHASWFRIVKEIWGEAATTVARLINRCPSFELNYKTPMEAWHGKIIDYSNLRVFISIAYAYVKEGKLEPRAVKCVFIGYLDGVKGYKLWKMEKGRGKCIISRDVIFHETKLGMLEEQQMEESSSKDHVQFEVESSAHSSKIDQTKNSEETIDGALSSVGVIGN
uniref:Retrovirus-related Pol polyprotein from transposon TNT 1-94 n=1 Tax=Cajanus cajan TaxID=3821 RepID=A0A151UB98_CAJCA|nr:Retrovirus-related Pol polyprotein from transposon TNT 1-94 [Cajanus cajan]